jgi:hypothetical protein
MAARPALLRGNIAALVPCLGACLLAGISAFAQTERTPQSPSAAPADHQDTVVGCLVDAQEALQLFDEEENVYVLTGRTSGLEKYAGSEISVQGTKDENAKPLPSLNVTSFKEIFRAPEPKLSPAFSDPSNWDSHTNSELGIKFALPRLQSSTEVSEPSDQGNFAANQGSVTVAGLEIPSAIYPDTNFAGGSFAIFANPRISNPQSCAQFGSSDPRFVSSRTIAGINYTELTEGDAAMGTSYEEYYFHTFQNNVCYELYFRLGSANTGSQPLGCRVSTLGEKDTLQVLDVLLDRVSFFRPTIETTAPVKPGSAPKVVSFTASSSTVDDAVNRGVITFSWSTQNADYVEFSYHCSVVTRPRLVILQEGGAGICDNDTNPGADYIQHFNRSPNSSTDIAFANMHSDDPITIVVTIQPFSHGEAYPKSSKSVTVTVDPYNPFPKGVPPETRNMTILYSARPDGTSKYAQGSQLKIDWTDSLPRDPCVDIYLVQDTGSGSAAFRLQIVKRCLTPAASGSFTWTIPTRYSGSSFRIYAAAPGGISSVLGAPFSIVRSEPGKP